MKLSETSLQSTVSVKAEGWNSPVLGDSRISVFIPVYKGSELLEPLLEKLTCTMPDYGEIFVVVDEPNKESLRIVERYHGKVCFILNNERKGKVEALNSAVKLSSGQILVFIDADVKVDGDINLWQVVRDAMCDADLIDFKKKIIKDSFISRMVNYEYLSSNFASYFFSRLVGKFFGVSGTAFAIKREVFEEVGGFSKVVSEDLDLAVKTFLRNKRFKYAEKVCVYTKAPSNWKSWLNQRKRWGIGTGLWIKTHWRKLVAHIVKYPHVALPCAIMIFPAVIPLLLSYVFSTVLEVQFHHFVPVVLAAQLGFAFPQVVHPSLLSIILTGLTNSFIGFLAFSTLFYVVSRRFGLHFNLAEFLVYYLVYQPIAVIVLFIGILRAFVSQNYELDWKV
ncbi:MAG: glycosyltransferase family 2 protein [Candidatus Bathyarchaeia archaeon]|nr:glycosyltransferase family 2 protein [Candidatus Bathyarchaeota archaeon]